MLESLESHESRNFCYIGKRSEPAPPWHPISFPDSIPKLDNFPGIGA